MFFRRSKYLFDLYKAKFYGYGCKKYVKPTNRANPFTPKPQKTITKKSNLKKPEIGKTLLSPFDFSFYF